MFTLVVTNSDMSTSNSLANQYDVERWKSLGRPSLSRALGSQKFPRGTKIWLMVYEFHPSPDSVIRLIATEQSTFPTSLHRKALGLP